MDRVTIHAEIGEADSDALVALDHERIGARPGAAVEGEDIEVGHDLGIRGEGAGLDRPFLQKDKEMAIDRLRITVLRDE